MQEKLPLPRVFGIVPAAGFSRRMGRPKQLIPIDGRTMLERTLAPLIASRLAGVALVTRPGVVESLPPLDAKVAVVVRDDPEGEMIDSIRAGLAELAERRLPAPRDGVLVCPGDQPGISPADIDRCIAAFAAEPQAIVVARHRGRPGHPIIFPLALAPIVRSAVCDEGLRALPRLHADRVRHVECKSAGVVLDVDRAEDLRQREFSVEQE